MKLLHKVIRFAVFAMILCTGPAALAKTILYVPQDNRPVDLAYTVSTAQDAGYTIITPPQKYLSGSNFKGSPEQLLQWVDAHAGEADAMVLSVDSLVYGGLVDSRKHNMDMATLVRRINEIEKIKNNHSHIPIYAFSTVMRSPWAGGQGVEPDYYLTYGNDIYELSALQSKMDEEGLNPQERTDWFNIVQRVPMEYLQDWYNRRRKNMMVNHILIQCAKKGIFTYFCLGHDDNSTHTQSALEAKYLETESKGVSNNVYGSFPGADQLGLLLITRASNDFNNYHPKITVIYPLGGGARTVPSYDGQEIGKTIKAHIEAVGGVITDKERPDLLLAVNTPLTTQTSESANFENFPIMLDSTKVFLGQIEKAIQAGIPVSIVDMAFSNGSDNTLVYGLYMDKIMYSLAAYNGWNTASNSVGYGVSQGILSKYMTADAHQRMLTTQYLDNWAYQANVRDYITRMQEKIKKNEEPQYFSTINAELQSRTKEQLQRYAKDYLGVDPRTIQVTLPWNRLFEVYVDVRAFPDIPLESRIREQMRQAENDRIKAQEDGAKAALSAAKQSSNSQNTVTAQAAVQQSAEADADEQQSDLQSQQIDQREELAQQQRIWSPSK
ncbi:DUF4127 family protein [Megasphaera sueciensis]|uniref:DUF4127 family protein n=1 Tax=Megasphaera sueciensis TaxID=349094 RepID=UPI003D089E4D